MKTKFWSISICLALTLLITLYALSFTTSTLKINSYEIQIDPGHKVASNPPLQQHEEIYQALAKQTLKDVSELEKLEHRLIVPVGREEEEFTRTIKFRANSRRYEAMSEVEVKVVPFFKYAYDEDRSIDESKGIEPCTLITAVTVSEFDELIELAKEWKGPISAAVQLTNKELISFVNDERLSNPLVRRYLDIHIVISDAFKQNGIVFSEEVATNETSSSEKEPLFFINFLRNVALNYSTSSMIYLADVHFKFTPLMYQDLTRSKELSIVREATKGGHVFVVPAFAFHRNIKEGDCDDTNCVEGIPINKGVLESKLDSWVELFHPKWKVGQSSVNYTRFFETNEPYYISWLDIGFEPFVIFRKEMLRGKGDLCDEAFYNRGGNKVICSFKLYSLGFNFAVHPNFYMIHRATTHETPSKPLRFMSYADRVFSDSIKRISTDQHCAFDREMEFKLGNMLPPICPKLYKKINAIQG